MAYSRTRLEKSWIRIRSADESAVELWCLGVLILRGLTLVQSGKAGGLTSYLLQPGRHPFHRKNIKIPASLIVHQKATATFASVAVGHITVFVPFDSFLTNDTNLARYENSDLGTCNSSPYIIQVIKSLIMRYAGHVARTMERRA
jgi:hypothetical protein